MRILKKELWPVKVTLPDTSKTSLTEMEIWMGQRFGTFKGRWNFVQHYQGTDVYFRNEHDATMFTLRWAA